MKIAAILLMSASACLFHPGNMRAAKARDIPAGHPAWAGSPRTMNFSVPKRMRGISIID
jgi:hypothetical protein